MSELQLPGRFFQMGIVVPNLDAAIAGMTGTLGTPRFMRLPDNPKQTWFRGSIEEISYRLAFSYFGDTQIEIIEPVSGPSTYSEFLARVPAGGIHHWGFEVTDFDAAIVEMKRRGYRTVQEGSFGETRFTYFENDNDPGVITEILYIDDAVKGMFESVKRQTIQV